MAVFQVALSGKKGSDGVLVAAAYDPKSSDSGSMLEIHRLSSKGRQAVVGSRILSCKISEVPKITMLGFRGVTGLQGKLKGDKAIKGDSGSRSLLIVGGATSTVYVFDATALLQDNLTNSSKLHKKLSLVAKVELPGDAPHACFFSLDNAWLALACNQGTLRVYNTGSLVPEDTKSAGFKPLSVAPDDKEEAETAKKGYAFKVDDGHADALAYGRRKNRNVLAVVSVQSRSLAFFEVDASGKGARGSASDTNGKPFKTIDMKLDGSGNEHVSVGFSHASGKGCKYLAVSCGKQIFVYDVEAFDLVRAAFSGCTAWTDQQVLCVAFNTFSEKQAGSFAVVNDDGMLSVSPSVAVIFATLILCA